MADQPPKDMKILGSPVLILSDVELDCEEWDDPRDTLTVAEADSTTVEELQNISPFTPPQEEVDSGKTTQFYINVCT